MKNIAQGVARFQQVAFSQHAKLFKKLATGQEPEVLFVTCADSRIDPSLITQTNPGDLFVCRNAGNIVPAHRHPSGDGMSASIEYAVQALPIKHIVVCGHSGCGAMQAALDLDSLGGMPHVRQWLTHSEAAVSVVKRRHKRSGEKQRLARLIEQNVVHQLHNLGTHPYVAERVDAGVLELHGWVYDIGSGGILAWDSESSEFKPFAERYDAPESVSA